MAETATVETTPRAWPLRSMRAPNAGRCRRCRRWYAPEELIQSTGGRFWPSSAVHVDDAACAAAEPDRPVEPRQTLSAHWEEFEAVGQLLEAHPWTFAKTMAAIPHQWTVLRQWASREDFARVVTGIRRFGQPRRWRTISNQKLDVNDHYYWVCDKPVSPVEYCMLINRSRRIVYEEQPAPWFRRWPEMKDDQAWLRERAGRPLQALRVLDIGGLWLEAAQQAREYLAIGPPGDLARMQAALGLMGRQAPALDTPIRSLVAPPFDLIVALHGAANHQQDDELARLPRMLTPGGRLLLMFTQETGRWTDGMIAGATVSTRGGFTIVEAHR